ncbi:hypothetical protein JX580_06045 [Thiomicrospira microaerophila]|uniref:hypothetical protein n=1 Tax=Thiomicrospira microaerophila TaxID=406020 RepID=UPI00200C1C40|nr:hypothetical protein [Thiomicrospira microaerophila]UQB41264.1 hypothetical protein JX580_06045 [Thiomicrospira microaerophila]
MHSITTDKVVDALLLMLGFTSVAVLIVGLVIYGVYLFFRNTKDDDNKRNQL